MDNEEWWAITKEFNFIVFEGTTAKGQMYWTCLNLRGTILMEGEDIMMVNWIEEMEDKYG